MSMAFRKKSMDEDWVIVSPERQPSYASHKLRFRHNYMIHLSSLAESIELLHLCSGARHSTVGLSACRLARLHQ